ncbi:MAG TPA: hypothetical protein VGK73_31760 [Polyangiaceae bacterium]
MIGWLKWGSTGVRVGPMATLDDVLRAVRELLRFSQAAAEFMTAISKSEILQGKRIDATTDGTANQNYFQHGLGRPFRGAIILGQNNGTTPVTLISAASVLNDNQDPSRVFGTSQGAVAVTFSAWVY